MQEVSKKFHHSRPYEEQVSNKLERSKVLEERMLGNIGDLLKAPVPPVKTVRFAMSPPCTSPASFRFPGLPLKSAEEKGRIPFVGSIMKVFVPSISCSFHKQSATFGQLNLKSRQSQLEGKKDPSLHLWGDDIALSSDRRSLAERPRGQSTVRRAGQPSGGVQDKADSPAIRLWTLTKDRAAICRALPKFHDGGVAVGCPPCTDSGTIAQYTYPTGWRPSRLCMREDTCRPRLQLTSRCRKLSSAMWKSR